MTTTPLNDNNFNLEARRVTPPTSEPPQPPPPPRKITLPNGEEIEVNVVKGGKNITANFTNDQLISTFSKTGQFFKTAAPGKQIKSTEIVLKGVSGVLDPSNLINQQVKIVGEPKFTYEEGGNVYQSTLPQYAQAVAFSQLDRLGSTFSGRTTVTSSAPAAAAQEYVETIQDTRMDICKNRAHSVVRIAPPVPGGPPPAAPGGPPPPPSMTPSQAYSTAIYALADQLKKMDNRPGTLHEIVDELRTQLPLYLVQNIAQWKKNEKFTNILQSLKKIELDPNIISQLQQAQLTTATFNILLGKNIADINDKEKEKLIRLYASYINHEGQNFDDTFFEIFTSRYQANGVVIIEGDGNNDNRALSYPIGNQIDTRRTLFVYRNTKNPRYESYNRDRDPVTDNVINLNDPQDVTYLHIPGTEQRTRKLITPLPDAAPTAPASSSSTASGSAPAATSVASPPPSASSLSAAPVVAVAPPRDPTPEEFETIEVDATGQCLDKSIAYQIMKKQGIENPKAPDQQGNLETMARKFRTDTAKYIRNTITLNDDVEFMLLLTASIGDMTESVPDNIREIVRQGTHESSDSGEALSAKNALRQFYANHIEKASSYLDKPFLFALTKLKPDLNVVVMRGTEIQMKFPLNEPLDINKTMFINYNGLVHHKAIDMNNENNKAKIAKVFVQDFMQYVNLQASHARIIKEKLQQMKHANLQAYGIIAEQIYGHDVAAWERSHYLNKPGTEPITVGKGTAEEKTYPPHEYGEYRIDTTREDELKTLLKDLTDNILNVATLQKMPNS
jgi:hypothetical protein